MNQSENLICFVSKSRVFESETDLLQGADNGADYAEITYEVEASNHKDALQQVNRFLDAVCGPNCWELLSFSQWEEVHP